MPNREFGTKVQSRFLARQVLTGATADGALGPAVDTLDHDNGIAFYVHAESFTSGQLDFQVEEADDSGFTVNQAVLDSNHYAEQPTLPVSLSAAQVAGQNNAVRIVIHSTRRFVRLRRSAAAFSGTVVATISMAPNFVPNATLSNQ